MISACKCIKTCAMNSLERNQRPRQNSKDRKLKNLMPKCNNSTYSARSGRREKLLLNNNGRGNFKLLKPRRARGTRTF